MEPYRPWKKKKEREKYAYFSLRAAFLRGSVHLLFFLFCYQDRISLLKSRYRVFFSPPLLASRRTTTGKDNLRNTVQFVFGYLLRDIVLVSRHACLLLAQWYPVRFGGFTVYVNVFFNRIARFSRKDYLLIFTPPRKLVIRLCLKRDFESLKRNR